MDSVFVSRSSLCHYRKCNIIPFVMNHIWKSIHLRSDNTAANGKIEDEGSRTHVHELRRKFSPPQIPVNFLLLERITRVATHK